METSKAHVKPMSMVRTDKIMPFTKRARLQEASTDTYQTSTCQLYSCQRPFKPKSTKGKRQIFCSPACRVKFFREARIIGAALLRKSLAGTEAENYVSNLMSGDISDDLDGRGQR